MPCSLYKLVNIYHCMVALYIVAINEHLYLSCMVYNSKKNEDLAKLRLCVAPGHIAK